jgi:hypothetical protein
MYKNTDFLATLVALSIFLGSDIQAQNALDFDGVDDYVETTYGGISGNAARTVEAWVNTTANCNPTNGGVQQVITDWGSNSQGGRFTMNVLWADAIRLEVNGNGVSGTIPINDGNWHHVAAVYDPSAPNPVSLYVDGSLDAAGSLTVSVNTGTDFDLRIGKRIEGIPMFDGMIDEVRVWNTALSQSAIAASMNAEICTIPSNLVAYYRFNQGDAGNMNFGQTTLADNSGNGNNGTLSNFTLSGSQSNWVNGAMLSVLDNTAQDDGFGNLSANASGIAYQWLDCNLGFAPISSETSQAFTPSGTGSFAVEVTDGSCIDTSSCMVVTTVGLTENADYNQLVIYPNPTNGQVTLQLPIEFLNSIVSVFNMSGQLVHSIPQVSSQRIEIDFILPKGFYLLEVESASGKILRTKLLKE